ncbi:hypothetical protein [Paraburkholderia sp. GAS82]|uniref:hypothetical protein n=1 Tax=Paraburkholderia sp. GAS82 TaxID=3035137 RepID=UPI003D23FA82
MPRPTEPSIHRCFFMHALRVEHFVHVDASLYDDILSEPARDLPQNDFDEVREGLLAGSLDFCHVDQTATLNDLEHWLAKLARKLDIGFLVQAQQPYFVADSHNCFGYSWKLIRTSWFFARQYGNALNQISSWGTRNHDEASTRFERASH